MGPDVFTLMEVRDFPGVGNARDVLPDFPQSDDRFFLSLAERRLVLQRCSTCDRARFPVAPACPYCRASSYDWEGIAPEGIVHSWVRYHRAFLPEFAQLLPYVVLAVELTSGPILVGRLVEAGPEPLIGMPVRAFVGRWADGGHTLAFTSNMEKS